jgi:hypothetical protein
MLASTSVINSIVELLTEAYAGPPDPSTTWFIDNEPDSGILGLLNGVSSEQASTSVDGSDENGTTIASHAEHLRWSLANMNAAIRGETFHGNWNESWMLLDADDARWDRLRSALRSEFETLRQALKSQTELPEEYLTGTIALLPHAAYHLGTIRQMISRVRKDLTGLGDL